MKTLQSIALVAAVLLWRIVKTCVFEVCLLVWFVVVVSNGWTMPLWFWVCLCASSAPAIFTVWNERGRQYAVEMSLAGKVHVTDITLSALMMCTIAIIVLFIGPWWAAVVLWVEAAHHGAMAAVIANALNKRDDLEGV